MNTHEVDCIVSLANSFGLMDEEELEYEDGFKVTLILNEENDKKYYIFW